MTIRTLSYLAVLVVAMHMLSGAAHGQISIEWSTIDCGGGRAAGGTFTIDATIGQSDAGPVMTGGALTFTGGFWPGVSSIPACGADFNGLNGVTIDDLFLYFNAYFSGDPRADFNGVGGVSIDDLFLFINAWFGGC